MATRPCCRCARRHAGRARGHAAGPEIVPDPASRTGAVAGVYFRLPLGGSASARERPRLGARLQVEQRLGPTRRLRADIVDLATSSGRPVSFRVAGQSWHGDGSTFAAEGRGRSGLANAALIAGSVVVTAGIGLAIRYDANTCSTDEAIDNECDRE